MKRITIIDRADPFWPQERLAVDAMIDDAPHTAARAVRLLLRDGYLATVADDTAHDLTTWLKKRPGGVPSKVTVAEI